jgi:hypothetical protein
MKTKKNKEIKLTKELAQQVNEATKKQPIGQEKIAFAKKLFGENLEKLDEKISQVLEAKNKV